MSKTEIKTYYKFEEGNISVAFNKILLITTELCDEEDLPEDFHTEERAYLLNIKQENTTSLTRVVVVESTYKDFEKSYFDYLDYKLEHPSFDSEVNAKLLKDAANFFEALESKVNLTLSNVTDSSKEQIENIKEQSTALLSKIDLFNEDLNSNLKNLKELNTSLENFALNEEDIETPKSELVDEDEDKVKYENEVN